MPYDKNGIFTKAKDLTVTVFPVNAKDLQSKINELTIPETCISVDVVDNAQENNVILHFNTVLEEQDELAVLSVVDNYVYHEEVDAAALPTTSYLGGKLAVHASSKPDIPGIETFVVWTGAGDDITQEDPALSIANGDLLEFQLSPGIGEVIKEIKFDPRHGRVWIHEAYLKFENGGTGDYITSDIVAPPTQLQTVANLDLEVDANGWVKLAAGGPGTGTHGFAATPALIKRAFSKDGDWDYDETNGLRPNLDGNGLYKISIYERTVSRYVNKIPCYGTTTNYVMMSSDETAELPVSLGYFMRVRAVNNSDTTWHATIFMEIYRQRTAVP